MGNRAGPLKLSAGTFWKGFGRGHYDSKRLKDAKSGTATEGKRLMNQGICMTPYPIDRKSAEDLILEIPLVLDPKVQVTAQLHLLVYVYPHLLRDTPLACLGRIIMVIDLMSHEVHALLFTPNDGGIEVIDDL
jgi:hypothetical protein